MNADYRDIIERIQEAPGWFDENAVLRYDPFTPNLTADIYCDEVALAEVTCQGCGWLFRVAMSRGLHGSMRHAKPLHEEIRNRDLSYGDPPNIGCCAAGPTMNAEPRRILEYWRRNPSYEWTRDITLEGECVPDWVLEPVE